MADSTAFAHIGDAVAGGHATLQLVGPFIAIVTLALALPLTLVMLNRLLGRWTHGVADRAPAKNQPFEAGLPATMGNPGEQVSVKFYLVAMLFLAFDIEVAFLYAWAWQYGHAPVGDWSLFFMLTGFLVLLEVGYVYLYRKGALDWDN